MFPYKDSRAFIEVLEKEGKLARIKAEVDWNLELGAIVTKGAGPGGKALLFENVRDHLPGYTFFTGALGDYERLALALGLAKDTPVDKIVAVYRERLKKPTKPRVVSAKEAPCKENVHVGEEVDLFEFPTPYWHTRDGGRYFGTLHCLTVKDPDSAWVNVAICRLMIHSEGTLGILMEKGQHTHLIYEKYLSRGRNMPVAIAVGQDPVNIIAAASSFEAGTSEWEMAGALRGQPVELVKCETSELLVPASAEIVVEGEVAINELQEEGPFGEFTGYYGGPRAPRPVVKVNCITHRKEPIHTGSLEGKPIVEGQVIGSIMTSAAVEGLLKDQLNLGIKRAFVHPWGSGLGLIVSMKPRYVGHVNRVAHAVWGAKAGRVISYIIVVEDDIDPTDLNQVLWAICTRCKPDRDIHVLSRTESTGLWPALTPEERSLALGSKALIDATFPADWPADWVPAVSDWWDYPEEVRKKVEANWSTYGF